MHPATAVRIVNEQVGYGVFATDFIPFGSMVFVKDIFDLEISSLQYQTLSEQYKGILKKYGYIDNEGNYILSWDHGKYVNHCCHPNTITTGYGFEIAIKDIYPGEEVTDEYGLLNLEEDFSLYCHKDGCRGTLRKSDWSLSVEKWDRLVQEALGQLLHVEQPLMPFLDHETRSLLIHYLNTGENYISVSSQICPPKLDPIQRLQELPMEALRQR